MVDVSGKNVTVRIAKARGTINLGDDAFGVLKSGGCNKGDVLATAKIAAVQAVKQTQTLIPLCHSLLIEAVTVEFDLVPPQCGLRALYSLIAVWSLYFFRQSSPAFFVIHLFTSFSSCQRS